MKKLLPLYLLLGFMASCGPKIIPTVDEDFSQYRNSYSYEREEYKGQDSKELELVLEYDSSQQRYDITRKLDELLSTPPPEPKKVTKKMVVDGYRIQVYRGRSREEASKARKRSYELFPNMTPYMIYNAPRYQVRVGDFLEPHEYKPYLKAFKRAFPQALAIPDRVTIIVQGTPEELKNYIEEENKNREE